LQNLKKTMPDQDAMDLSDQALNVLQTEFGAVLRGQ